MNSQPKWKEMHCNDSSTFAKFDNSVYDNERKFYFDKDAVKWVKKSAGSINVKHASRHFQPNVLTNHNSMGNCRNTSRQYHKSSHHLSSASQNTMILSQMQNSGNVANFFPRNSSILTNSDGVIHISLRHGVQIDVTVDNSILLTSCDGQIVIALSKTGEECAVKHPNGMVQQIDNLVEIVTNDPSENPINARYATMNGNCITFTNGTLVDMEASSFSLDAVGTRQSKKPFTELTAGDTSSVFFGKSKHGPRYNDEISHLIQKASVKRCTEDGMDVITVNDFRIWQMKDGLVTVARMSSPFKIRASPMNCSFTLSTAHIHCTASSQQSSHLFVRCQDQSMHFDGKNFVVRYNGN